MSKLSPPAGSPQWKDLIAFVAVLAACVVLIVLGHLTAAGVTSICAAVVGLHKEWRRSRLRRAGQQQARQFCPPRQPSLST